jgi:hypothetical protein
MVMHVSLPRRQSRNVKYLKFVGYICDLIVRIVYSEWWSDDGSHGPQAMMCHGFDAGVLAGKSCVLDAQMSNAVYIPMPQPHLA